MGLEYPYLALVTFMLFTAMTVSLISSYLWIHHQLSRIPEVAGYAEYREINSTFAEITVTMQHRKGDPVTVVGLLLGTEQGVVKVDVTGSVTNVTVGNSTIIVTLKKFDGTLGPGQVGLLVISVKNPGDLFQYGMEYAVHIIFDLGMLHTRFMP
jgi:hypothetical protein